MDVIVHGTKGGRQIFSPKKIGGLVDVTPDSSNLSAIGKEAYGIRFIEGATIYSKYKIVRDVRGDKRIGFLGISLIIPNNKRLSGSNIVSLLNEVLLEYCRRYMAEGDNNLRDVREVWTFLDQISYSYQGRLDSLPAEEEENWISGNRDDAFIYYKTDQELDSYFNIPYQEEYVPYRQVLFVKEEFKGRSENPLNALRHSGDNLTGRIDPVNPKYRLLYSPITKDGVMINVRTGDRILPNKSKVKLDDELVVTWEKKYCKRLEKRGRATQLKGDYLQVIYENAIIRLKDVNLPVVTKSIKFNFIDWRVDPVDGLKISCENESGLRKEIRENAIITFTGIEIGQSWTITASADNVETIQEKLNIEKDCPGESCKKDIKLDKHRIKVIAHEDDLTGTVINNVKYSKDLFIGPDIGKEHKIEVLNPQFEKCNFNYHPDKDKGGKHIVLRPRENKKDDETILASYSNHGDKIQPVKYAQNNADKMSTLGRRSKFIFTGSIILLIALSIGIGMLIYKHVFSNGKQDSGPHKAKVNIGNTKNQKQSQDTIKNNNSEEEPNTKTSDPSKNAPQPNVGSNSQSERNDMSRKIIYKRKTDPAARSPYIDLKKILSSGEITLDSLEKLKSEKIRPENEKFKIDIYIKFWHYNNGEYKLGDFKKLRNEINKQEIYTDSELKKYLDEICRDDTSFAKYEKISGKKKIKTLADLKTKTQ